MATKKATKKSSAKRSPSDSKRAVKKSGSVRSGRARTGQAVRLLQVSDFVVLFACDATTMDRENAEALLTQFVSALAEAKVVALAQLPGSDSD